MASDAPPPDEEAPSKSWMSEASAAADIFKDAFQDEVIESQSLGGDFSDDPYTDEAAGALPPRKGTKKKKRKESGTSSKPKEREPEASPLAFLNSLPVSPKAAIAGAAFMVCGILFGWVILGMFSGNGDEAPANAIAKNQNGAAGNANQRNPNQRNINPPNANRGGVNNRKAVAATTPPRQKPPGAQGKASASNKSPANSSTANSSRQGDSLNNRMPGENTPSTASSKPPAKRTRAEAVAYLKAATVFIKVKTTEGEQTGSGFIIQSKDGTGIVVTNAHVIDPAEGTLRKIECVFHSGRPNEFVVEAKIAGRDEPDDVAALTVRHKDLPEPIVVEQKVSLVETMPVLVVGFPFGEALAVHDGNPDITISKASVSSIRRDEDNNLAFIQLDGGINSGNSGGPVVTENGELIGVSVAKLRGTEIGLAIPQPVLQKSLQGKVTAMQIERIRESSSSTSFHSKVDLMDPHRNIRSVHLLTCPSSDVQQQKPDKDGKWQKVSPRMQESSLRISGAVASADIRIRESYSTTIAQVRWKMNDGTEVLSAPVSLGEARTRKFAIGELGMGQIVTLGKSPGKLIALPAVMADFAINPQNGDIASVDPIAGTTRLLRKAATDGGNKPNEEDLPKIKTGNVPVSIVFKQYDGKNYFAVVCSMSPSLYLIDAEKFSLVKKIPITGPGVSSVVCSQNPEDPFLYYCYGSGHQSSTGAVDLRKLQDRGKVFAKSMDCAISANGRIAYIRGPWSPSGFESLMMSNSFRDEKPIFVSSHREHRSSGAYLPDTVGSLTAAGKLLYTPSLSKKLGSLEFTPMCFLKDRPVVIGLEGNEIRSASCNTLKRTGVSFVLPEEICGPGAALPRGVRSSADFKRLGVQKRLMADEKNNRLIYAFGNAVVVLPFDILEIPDEPFFSVKADQSELVVDKYTRVRITPDDSRVTVKLEELPPGANELEDGFEITPDIASVGTIHVLATVTFEDLSRVITIPFQVTQDTIDAPFDIAGMCVDIEEKHAACWSSRGIDKYGRQIKTEDGLAWLSVLDLNDKNQATSKKRLPFGVRQAVMGDGKLIMLPSDDSARAEVYSTSQMKRIKTLLCPDNIVSLALEGDNLRLQSAHAVDIYSLKTLRRLRTIDSPASSSSSSSTSRPSKFVDGVLSNGVLLDPSGEKKMLIVSPGRLPTLGKASSMLLNGSFLRQYPKETSSSRSSRDGIVMGPIKVPNRNFYASLEAKTAVVHDTSTRNFSRKTEITLVISRNKDGGRIERVPIMKRNSTSITSSKLKPPTMHLANSFIYIAVENSIFRWPHGSLDNEDEGIDTSEFHIVPTQSTFALGPNANTKLTHKVAGGSQPYEFFLMTRLNCVTMDDETGDVTINNDLLQKDAIPMLIRIVRGEESASAVMQKLQSAATSAQRDAAKLLGKKPRGYPLAIPIHIKVIEANGKMTQLQYFVIADLSIKTIAPKVFAEL